jgi:hypothetical protein
MHKASHPIGFPILFQAILIFCLAFCSACVHSESQRKNEAAIAGQPGDTITRVATSSPLASPVANPIVPDTTTSTLMVRSFQNQSQDWGYDILQNGKIYIHQPHIPGIAGNLGFESEADAQKVAQLVILKIVQQQTPPSISQQELDSLGVL